MPNAVAINLMDKLDKLIQLIRNLKEEGVISSGPINVANAAGLGFDPQTETPPVFKKKKKNIYLGIGSRKRWMRNPPQI
jgi:hypothetical protein